MEAARGRSVEAGVPGDRLFRGIPEVALRPNHHRPARQALSNVVVRLPVQRQLDSFAQERPEALAGGAPEFQPDLVARAPSGEIGAPDLAALERAGQAGAEGAVGRGHREDLGRDGQPSDEVRYQAVLDVRCLRPGDEFARAGRILAPSRIHLPLGAPDQWLQDVPASSSNRLEPPRLANDLAH